MKHLKAVNLKAARIDRHLHVTDSDPQRTGSCTTNEGDVVALQQGPPQQPQTPHFPLGCSLIFSPGWEADQNGGTAGLCQPVERDLFDCHITCFWPAHVPDLYNHAPDWTGKCASAQKDWRKIDLIFP